MHTRVMARPREDERWWHHRGPIMSGTATTAGVLTGLLVGQLSDAPAVVVISLVLAAALIPGVTGMRQARHAAVDRAIQEQALRKLREREVVVEVERGTTAAALAAIGAALFRVVADPLRTDDYGRAVLRELYRVLSNRASRRVLFLQYHGGTNQGLPEPIHREDGGKPVVFTNCWSIGEQEHVIWEIRADEDSAKVAKWIMDREPPWKGALLIDDITKPEFIDGGYDVLRPPEREVASYCRAAVTFGDRHLGILCVDCWEPGALSRADRTVIESFAVLLAAGLNVSRESGTP